MISRRNFVKKTCSLCIGGPLLSSILSSCAGSHYVNGTLEKEGISVLASEFAIAKDAGTEYRPSIILKNDKLDYPIFLYRFSEKQYTALLMKCTHQGTELQSSGDQLYCPAHGSEFTNKGTVSHGPAEASLRRFSVQVLPEKLLIELK
jgi:Rieske Fe-S protein